MAFVKTMSLFLEVFTREKMRNADRVNMTFGYRLQHEADESEASYSETLIGTIGYQA